MLDKINFESDLKIIKLTKSKGFWGFGVEEMKLYSQFVAVDSYMIVEDTHVSGHPIKWEYGKGPFEAVNKFLKTNDDFVVDKECEKFIMTFNPNGYLKRIKKGA